MTYDKATDQMVPELGDDPLTLETAQNANKLLSALQWFAEHGINVEVRSTHKGHNFTFSKKK